MPRPNPSTATLRDLLPFYLEGREDASEDFDADEIDVVALARTICEGRTVDPLAAIASIRSVAVDAVVVPGHVGDWSKEYGAQCEEAGLDPGECFAAWRNGFVAEAAVVLEAEIVNVLADEDLADEITAVETPAAKRASSRPAANPSDAGSYAAWFETGMQDCQNTFDADELDSEIETAVKTFQKHRQDIGNLATEAVQAFWKEDAADRKREWLAQHEDDVRADRLKPDRAYEFWADGWRTQAKKYVAKVIAERV